MKHIQAWRDALGTVPRAADGPAAGEAARRSVFDWLDGVGNRAAKSCSSRRALGRPGGPKTGFRLGVIPHVALAALLSEDVHGDVVELLELSEGVRAGRLQVELCQAVGVGQGGFVCVAAARHEPAPEILETVVGATAVNYIGGTPQIPGVGLVQQVAKRDLERDQLFEGQLAQCRPETFRAVVGIEDGSDVALDESLETVYRHC